MARVGKVSEVQMIPPIINAAFRVASMILRASSLGDNAARLSLTHGWEHAAMTTLDQCRQRATECREMVDRAPNPGVQTLLNHLAKDWDRLAFQVEHLKQMTGAGRSSEAHGNLTNLELSWERLKSEAELLDQKSQRLLQALRPPAT